MTTNDPQTNKYIVISVDYAAERNSSWVPLLDSQRRIFAHSAAKAPLEEKPMPYFGRRWLGFV